MAVPSVGLTAQQVDTELAERQRRIEQATIVQTIQETVSKALPLGFGAIAGTFANSPVLGLGAAFITEKIRESTAAERERKAAAQQEKRRQQEVADLIIRQRGIQDTEANRQLILDELQKKRDQQAQENLKLENEKLLQEYNLEETNLNMLNVMIATRDLLSEQNEIVKDDAQRAELDSIQQAERDAELARKQDEQTKALERVGDSTEENAEESGGLFSMLKDKALGALGIGAAGATGGLAATGGSIFAGLGTAASGAAAAAGPIAAIATGLVLTAKDGIDLAMDGLDDDIKTQVQGEDIGGTIGGIIGGAIGAIGGPIGIGIGASVGNIVGSFVGGLIDPDTEAKFEEIRADVEGKQTALNNQLSVLRDSLNKGMITREEFALQEAEIQNQLTQLAEDELNLVGVEKLKDVRDSIGDKYNELALQIEKLEEAGVAVPESLRQSLDETEKKFIKADEAFDKATNALDDKNEGFFSRLFGSGDDTEEEPNADGVRADALKVELEKQRQELELAQQDLEDAYAEGKTGRRITNRERNVAALRKEFEDTAKSLEELGVEVEGVEQVKTEFKQVEDVEKVKSPSDRPISSRREEANRRKERLAEMSDQVNEEDADFFNIESKEKADSIVAGLIQRNQGGAYKIGRQENGLYYIARIATSRSGRGGSDGLEIQDTGREQVGADIARGSRQGRDASGPSTNVVAPTTNVQNTSQNTYQSGPLKTTGDLYETYDRASF